MRRLLLMRHAKAGPYDPGADSQRPLVERGREDAARAGARLYGASAGELIGIVQEVDDTVETLMLVGHNPGTHMLAVTLAGRGAALEQLAAKFPTAGVADLRFDTCWSEVAPDAGELAGFYVPRDRR